MQVASHAYSLYLEGGESTLAGLAHFDRDRAQIDATWDWARQLAGSRMADAAKAMD